MTTLERLLSAVLASILVVVMSPTSAAQPQNPKNWTPPSYRIYAQALSDDIMSKHPELLSVTFHGVPPGMSGVYTMFAGSYPDRIGNPDDPDDVMVSETGVTIIDPRWHRTKDAVRKFVMMVPLRDAAAENIGLLVLAYKYPFDSRQTDRDFFVAASELRDGLERQIPSYAALFERAK